MTGNVFGLMVLLVLAVVYIVYLRIQLYINNRIVKAFQNSAVVIPQAKAKQSGLPIAAVVVGMFMLLMAMATLMR